MAISSNPRTQAGKKIFVSSTAMDRSTSLTSSSFTATTWIEVKGLNNIGKIDRQFNKTTVSQINDPMDFEIVGSEQVPKSTFEFIKIEGDAGQAALAAMVGTKLYYPVKIVGNEIGAVTPSSIIFLAIIDMSLSDGGSVNDVEKMAAEFSRVSNIVSSAAA